MEQIRSFVAIELSDDVKSELDRLEARLKSGDAPRVKWVNPESVHLTLKFLGNIPADKVGKIVGALTEAVQEI